MAITRLFQMGGEVDGSNSHLIEWHAVLDVSTPVTYPKTGERSFYLNDVYGQNYAIRSTPYAISQGRAGMWCLLGDVYDSGPRDLVTLQTNGVGLVEVRLHKTDRVLSLYLNDVLQDTGTTVIPVFSDEEDYIHIGIDFKIANSGGWIYVYLNGVEELSMDGDTLAGSYSEVDALMVGRSYGTVKTSYWDDIYMDATAGEAAPATVPSLRFGYIRPDGNGNSSGLTGSDGNQVDNYLLVDDEPHDDDTTYVLALAATLKDTYAMEAFVVPDGWDIAAIIPCHIIRKIRAEVANQVKTVVRSSASEAAGSAQGLPTSYGLLWERQITDPNGDVAWTQGALDSVEIGVESAGTF